MKPELRVAVAIGTMLALAACAPRSVTTVATLALDGASEAEIRVAATVLQSRYRNLVSSYFAEVSASANPSGVTVEFRGEAPSDDLIRLYANTQGVMRIAPEKAHLVSIATDRDVESASAYIDGDVAGLNLVLKERAGQQMLDYTRSHQGATLVTTWDGTEFSRAQINGIFGRQFQMTGVDRNMMGLRAIVLRSGRLPMPVTSVVIVHPTR